MLFHSGSYFDFYYLEMVFQVASKLLQIIFAFHDRTNVIGFICLHSEMRGQNFCNLQIWSVLLDFQFGPWHKINPKQIVRRLTSFAND